MNSILDDQYPLRVAWNSAWNSDFKSIWHKAWANSTHLTSKDMGSLYHLMKLMFFLTYKHYD